MMIAVGEDIVARRLPIIRSTRLIREMRMFVEFAKNATNTGGIIAGDENYRRVRVGATSGEKDDLVMAWLGAQMVCDQSSGRRAWEEPDTGFEPLVVPEDHVGSNRTAHWEVEDVEVHTGRATEAGGSSRGAIGGGWV